MFRDHESDKAIQNRLKIRVEKAEKMFLKLWDYVSHPDTTYEECKAKLKEYQNSENELFEARKRLDCFKRTGSEYGERISYATPRNANLKERY